MGKRMTAEEFIQRAQKVQAEKGREYDYSLVEYKNSKTKVKIICPEHGLFEQRPDDHLKGSGCLYCGKTKKLTQKEFIKRANKVHNNYYDYSEVKYNNSQSKIKIKCPEHGIFEQEANSHLQGHKCPKCGQQSRQQTFLKKYGVKNPMQIKEFKIKSQKTNLEKYGVEHILQSAIFQRKARESNLRKYGVENASQNEEIKQKKIEKSFPGINYERWSSLTKKFIEENFIDENNNLIVQELMDYVGWETPTPAYKKCHELGVKWSYDLGGFDPTKPATLYYIYDPQEDMYKIGITNHDVYARFGGGFCSKRAIAILEQWYYEIGEHAYLAEQEVLKAFKDYRTTNPSWPEELGGKTEFFKIDVLGLNS